MNPHLHHHPTLNLISSAFRSCNDLKTLKQIHASLLISNGVKGNETILPNLVSLYAKFGCCSSLFAVLKSTKKPYSFLWNLSIKTRVVSGDVESAFFLYKEMRVMGVEHDSYTFPIVNQTVLLLRSKEESFWLGKIIHGLAFRMGFLSDVYFCNTMIEVYVKDMAFEDARKVFREMPNRDTVSWSSMLSGYVREGNVTGAFTWFSKMLDEAVPKPNAVTMLVMLQGCPGASEVGQLHGYLIKNGWLGYLAVGNSLMKTYIDHVGCVADAKILLGEMDRRDIVS